MYLKTRRGRQVEGRSVRLVKSGIDGSDVTLLVDLGQGLKCEGCLCIILPPLMDPICEIETEGRGC